MHLCKTRKVKFKNEKHCPFTSFVSLISFKISVGQFLLNHECYLRIIYLRLFFVMQTLNTYTRRIQKLQEVTKELQDTPSQRTTFARAAVKLNSCTSFVFCVPRMTDLKCVKFSIFFLYESKCTMIVATGKESPA